MISLFIDTSFSDVSIALIRDEKVLSLIHKDIPMSILFMSLNILMMF